MGTMLVTAARKALQVKTQIDSRFRFTEAPVSSFIYKKMRTRATHPNTHAHTGRRVLDQRGEHPRQHRLPAGQDALHLQGPQGDII